METMRTLPIERTRKFARLMSIIFALMLLAGCGIGGRPSYSPTGEGQTAATPRPTMTLTPTPTELPWPTFVVDHDGIPTPAPDVAQRVALPEETKVGSCWVQKASCLPEGAPMPFIFC